MDLASVPWKDAYPPGLSPDHPLRAYPVHEIVDRAAERWGSRTAFSFRGQPLIFRDLKAEVDRCAAAFQRAGIEAGTRVALLLPNTLYHPICFFGALKAGATVVHLSPLDAERVLAHKLADSGARMLVTTNMGELAPRAEALLDLGALDRVILCEDARFGTSPFEGPSISGARVTSFTDFTEGAASASLPDISAGDLALLQYTGGTTGMPKGAMLTHGNLTTAVESYDAWFAAWGLTRPAEDRVLLFLPLFHIYALTAVMLRALNNGLELILHTRFDAETALAEIEAGATSFPGVPTMWIAIAATPGFETRNLSSLRYCASGGAPLPVEIARRLKAATGHNIVGGWGMTETSPAGTNIPVNRPDKVATIGVPLPGIRLDIVAPDDPSRVLPQGQTGELRIFGPNVTTGYLNRDDETREAFSEGGFLTGDIGFMDDEGFFTIIDRKKDMLLCGGFNVYPQMIEQAIYEHPDVEEVLVIGVADGYRGETPKAFIKQRKGSDALTIEALRDFLRTRLGPHELPTRLELRDALPRTTVGKLSKLDLKKEEAERG
ncbi:AMP-binding protein [Mesorhizobium sp. CAU 1732]|uniref:AMP-binding protein n=1 Tax=Mesorhizobium sp. CAU 1732 TaxID=3140358 RepID=UPI00325FF880